MLGYLSILVNATGWNELMDGRLISAAFVMYDTALAGWTVVILFFIYQLMLILKTRNLTLSWITGIFFAAMFVSSQALTSSGNPVLRPIAVQIIFAILVLELGAILFIWLSK